MFRSISVLCIFVSAGTSLNFQQERWGSKNKSLTGLPNTQLIIARIALYSWSFLSKQYQSFLCTRTIEDKEHAWDTGSLFSASSNSAKHVSTSGLGLRQCHCGRTEQRLPNLPQVPFRLFKVYTSGNTSSRARHTRILSKDNQHLEAVQTSMDFIMFLSHWSSEATCSVQVGQEGWTLYAICYLHGPW